MPPSLTAAAAAAAGPVGLHHLSSGCDLGGTSSPAVAEPVGDRHLGYPTRSLDAQPGCHKHVLGLVPGSGPSFAGRHTTLCNTVW